MGKWLSLGLEQGEPLYLAGPESREVVEKKSKKKQNKTTVWVSLRDTGVN